MERQKLSRTSLERLSTPELFRLAETYDVDIPDSLDRQLLIGEILIMDLEADRRDSLAAEENAAQNDSFFIPQTNIALLFQNPAWSYIAWDIRENEKRDLIDNEAFEYFFLRVNNYQNAGSCACDDSFDVKISPEDKSWYTYLIGFGMWWDVELRCALQDESRILCVSQRRRQPYPPCPPSGGANKLAELSGINELGSLHFREYRQLFSD